MLFLQRLLPTTLTAWIVAGDLALAMSSASSSSGRIRPLSHPRRGSSDPLSIERTVQQQHQRRPINNKHQYHHDNHNNQKLLVVLGSDESGSGAMAGPIVAASCAIVVPLEKYVPILPGVDDAKRLSPAHRHRIYHDILDGPETYAWSLSVHWPPPYDDDRDDDDDDVSTSSTMGQVALQAIRESIRDLANDKKLSNCSLYSIVDGYKAPKLQNGCSTDANANAAAANAEAIYSFPCRPWVHGDATVYTVALASILARVTRDQLMTQSVARQFPQYGFEHHFGYATRQHVAALHQYGPCDVHWSVCRPVQQTRTSGTAWNANGRVNNPSIRRRNFGSRHDFLVAGSGVATLTAVWTRPAAAMTVNPKTGISYPGVGEIAAAVPTDWTNIDNPIDESSSSSSTSSSSSPFARLDTSSDLEFYRDPRFVEHVDEQAVKLMTDYVTKTAIDPSTQSVLDLCSSWTSHMGNITRPRVAGLGMNAKELQANPSLTEWTIQDLNVNPKLDYADNSFDVVLCQLSIDYLTRPLEVCREVGRILKPGGTFHVLFSNRLFLSKAVAIWTGADDIDHAFTVASYLHFCNGGFTNIEAVDLSLRRTRDQQVVGDPMYVVRASKLA